MIDYYKWCECGCGKNDDKILRNSIQLWNGKLYIFDDVKIIRQSVIAMKILFFLFSLYGHTQKRPSVSSILILVIIIIIYWKNEINLI